MSDIRVNMEIARQVFTEEQLLVMCDYFRVQAPSVVRVTEEADEDPWEEEISVYDVTRELGIQVDSNPSISEVDVAVARILLSGIADHLPQWAAVDVEKGEVYLERDNSWAKTLAATPHVAVIPRQLLTVDWGHAPMMSWPETHHLIWVPGFDRFVVTGAVDSAGLYGPTEFALDHFGPDEDLEASIKSILQVWWMEQRRGWDVCPWVLYQGYLISNETALAWRDEVWATDDEDEDDEDEDWEEEDDEEGEEASES